MSQLLFLTANNSTVFLTSNSEMEVPSLQLQTLYSLAGKLEEYSTDTLSLLPTSLRRQLLLCLPIIDICQLEREPTFMNGIDSAEEIWPEIEIDTIALKIRRVENVFFSDVIFSGPETIKDDLLSKIAHTFITSQARGRSLVKVLAYYLYGVVIDEDMHEITLACYKEQSPVLVDNDTLGLSQVGCASTLCN